MALQDIDDAVAFYLEEQAPSAALGFLDALEKAFGHLSKHGATGSPRYAHELDLAGLRFWPLARFPWRVFYLEQDHDIDVWRVLHSQRDIPLAMTDPRQAPAGHGASESKK